MNLLLDSHILLAVTRRDVLGTFGNQIDQLLRFPNHVKFVSAASLWEIAIKFHLGKLSLALPLERFAGYFQALEYTLLPVDHRHAIVDLADAPATRDPFDRILLAQCEIEGLKLVTVDRALSSHRLSWRAV